jgi:hypothetical protein
LAVTPCSILVIREIWVGGSQPGKRRSKGMERRSFASLGRRGSCEGMERASVASDAT